MCLRKMNFNLSRSGPPTFADAYGEVTSCNVGYQEVSRCSTRDGCWANVHFMVAPSPTTRTIPTPDDPTRGGWDGTGAFNTSQNSYVHSVLDFLFDCWFNWVSPNGTLLVYLPSRSKSTVTYLNKQQLYLGAGTNLTEHKSILNMLQLVVPNWTIHCATEYWGQFH